MASGRQLFQLPFSGGLVENDVFPNQCLVMEMPVSEKLLPVLCLVCLMWLCERFLLQRVAFQFAGKVLEFGMTMAHSQFHLCDTALLQRNP